MPHIKTRPFESNRLEALAGEGGIVSFRAVSQSKEKRGTEELIGIEFENESFAIELHKREDEYLLKPEKSTRPLNVNRIKRALRYIAEEAKLEVLHDNVSYSSSKPPLAEQYNKRINEFENPDFGGRKIAVEVGFGSGRHLLHQAKARPDILHIGIEIHTPSAEQVLKQIEIQELTNVWVVNYDARLLLEMLPSNSATAVYVHFPVPWDKKPHRRVIGDLFVTEALRILEPNGKLELRTDSDNYYEYALGILSSFDEASLTETKNEEAVIRSKYEDRWQRQGKNIYTLTLVSGRIDKPLNNNYDFSFSGPHKPIDDLLSLPQKPIVAEDHFVHFEKRYRLTSGDGGLLKCSFGSFDRPEHKLIMVRGDDTFYYPSLPVKSATNNYAHQTIEEYIYA